MNAYHEKLAAAIPLVNPDAAVITNIDGPTLVPHMVSPMAGHFRECPAKKRFSPSFFFFIKLTQNQMPISTTR
jgi:hypothetical protein